MNPRSRWGSEEKDFVQTQAIQLNGILQTRRAHPRLGEGEVTGAGLQEGGSENGKTLGLDRKAGQETEHM